MNRVYLLEAGSSRELKFNISTIDGGWGTCKTGKFLMNGPLSSGYFHDANIFFQLINKRLPLAAQLIISDDLIQYICEYYNMTFGCSITQNDILNNEIVSRNINIERLYRHLEEKIEDFEKNKDESENQEFDINSPLIKLSLTKNYLLEYIYESLSLVCYYCFSIYHKILASYIINYGGNVISFNWDILLDEALNDTGKWNYKDGYGIEFKDIIYKVEETEDIALQYKSTNLILKAHGSINWYNRTNEESGLYLFIPLKRNLRGGSLDTLRAYEYDNDRKQYFTSIVPPGVKRKTYPEIWVQIKDMLEKADEIIAIGFSFNDNDKHIREEFQGIDFNKSLQINLINPQADRLIDAYRDVFKTNNILKIHDTLGDYCQWIVKQERMGELESSLQ